MLMEHKSQEQKVGLLGHLGIQVHLKKYAVVIKLILICFFRPALNVYTQTSNTK